MASAAEDFGLPAALLERLRTLTLSGRRALAGPAGGRRRSPRAGSSAELLDYRDYSRGDDLRHVDWNAYARFERLYLRLYRAEDNLRLRLLVDVSASMGWGRPPKLQLAKALAAALAYVGLLGQDRVQAAAFGGEAEARAPAAQGAGAAPRVWAFLHGLQASGGADLTRALAAAALADRQPGLSVVLSDGLYPGGLRPGLARLLAAGHDLVLCHVLAPEELDPRFGEEWRLVDAEGAAPPAEVTPGAATLAAYRRRLGAYRDELRAFCRRHGAAYVPLAADTGVEEAVLTLGRRAGLFA